MNFKIIIVECLPDFISIPQPDRVSYGLFSDHIHLRGFSSAHITPEKNTTV